MEKRPTAPIENFCDTTNRVGIMRLTLSVAITHVISPSVLALILTTHPIRMAKVMFEHDQSVLSFLAGKITLIEEQLINGLG